MITADIIVGGLIIIINLIPIILRKGKYIPFTITLSLVIALIFNFMK